MWFLPMYAANIPLKNGIHNVISNFCLKFLLFPKRVTIFDHVETRHFVTQSISMHNPVKPVRFTLVIFYCRCRGILSPARNFEPPNSQALTATALES